jgi:L-asparaginase II
MLKKHKPRRSGLYSPIFEITRGEIVESIHFGAIAVVNAQGQLVAWHGNPELVTFLRSSSKPVQLLPFLEHGGQAAYGLTLREIALMCGSHSGTDEHVAVLRSVQARVGIRESDLLCGVHPIYHKPTVEAMRQRGEALSPNRHNCSGKHTAMMAHARLHDFPIADYANPSHPIQQEILQAFSEICALSPDQVKVGIDGCSVPNFAVPLHNAAWAFARLCDPVGLPPMRVDACHTITTAMTYNPDMVGGPDSFDTRLMEVSGGRLVCKGGAEGYQCFGLLPGALGPDSTALGIAFKISDGDLKSRGYPEGDARGRVRPAVTMEILRQLGAMSKTELHALSDFGPSFPINNWRKLLVGEARPCFQLRKVS